MTRMQVLEKCIELDPFLHMPDGHLTPVDNYANNMDFLNGWLTGDECSQLIFKWLFDGSGQSFDSVV